MNGLKTLVEVCEMTGISRRAIQGYEKEGLVAARDKNKYGHLLYDAQSIERIQRIRLYHQLGFKIKEIKEIIDSPAHILQSVLQEKVELLEIDIAEKWQVILQVQKIIEELQEKK